MIKNKINVESNKENSKENKKVLNTIEDIQSICKNKEVIHSEGMSMTEIASALGLDYNTSKSTLIKACAKLEKLFKETDYRDELAEYNSKSYQRY